MEKAYDAACALKIDKFEDVAHVFEAFKWMSWLNLCLHALRRPLSTRALRHLITAAQPLLLADEVIVRTITAIVTRAR